MIETISYGPDREEELFIPSGPGFELLQWLPPEGSEPEWTTRSPVIAWRIWTGYEFVCDSVAIAINGRSSERYTAVLCPQGYVRVNDYGSIFANEKEWLEWVREEWRKSKLETEEAA
jgi:hypothetical protein